MLADWFVVPLRLSKKLSQRRIFALGIARGLLEPRLAGELLGQVPHAAGALQRPGRAVPGQRRRAGGPGAVSAGGAAGLLPGPGVH